MVISMAITKIHPIKATLNMLFVIIILIKRVYMETTIYGYRIIIVIEIKN